MKAGREPDTEVSEVSVDQNKKPLQINSRNHRGGHICAAAAGLEVNIDKCTATLLRVFVWVQLKAKVTARNSSNNPVTIEIDSTDFTAKYEGV